MWKLTFAIVVVAAICGVSMPASDATEPCHRSEFKTDLIKNACAKGGQPEAKAVMKQFVREKKIKTCNQCHTKLAPTYELKPDGLAQFQKLGGM